MSERFLLLERRIEEDLAAIERLYAELGEPELRGDEPQETLIVVAYRLHQLYNAFENIFRNVAATFENALDRDEWHTQLLQRMRLDLSPVRPAVIDGPAFAALDELRRFRHVFRSIYGATLDAAKLRLVTAKAVELRPLYLPPIRRFLGFLRGLQ